jgi:hypothetical protein
MSIAALQIAKCMIESETGLIEFCGQGGLLRLEKLCMRRNRLKPSPLDPTVEVGGSTYPICVSIVREAQTVNLGVEESASNMWAREHPT